MLQSHEVADLQRQQDRERRGHEERRVVEEETDRGRDRDDRNDPDEVLPGGFRQVVSAWIGYSGRVEKR